MKKYILSAALFIGNYAVAQMLEVSDSEKIVYYAPTPVLNVNLLTLEKDGGVLTLTLNYDGSASRSQNRELGIQYPGYNLRALVVQMTNPQLMIRIPEINLNQPTVVQQSQMGPLISAQYSLTVDQVIRLKALLKNSVNVIKIEIPVRATIRSPQTLESYVAPAGVCEDLRVKNVGDLIEALTRLKKPARMQYDGTFDSYKKNLQENCFDVASSTAIHSFRDLMATELRLKSPLPELRGSNSENRLHDVNMNLVPKIEYEIY